MIKSKLFGLSLFLLSMFGLSAGAVDYSGHYKDIPISLQQVVPVVIPANEVNVSDFGGKGDAVTLNTEAFEKAVSALSKRGGGRLTVSAGVWLTGPIRLKSNIELHIEKNAIIYFSPDKQLFVDKEGKAKRCDPGIRAVDCKNIAITGQGIIDGNGDQWRPVKRGKVSDTEWSYFKSIGGVERQNGNLWYPWNVKAGYGNIAATAEKQEAMRNDVIRLTNCENVLIEGVTVQNSPRFHVHPVNCRNVIIDGITVRCPWNAQNGDAIDLSDCQQALVVNSTVDAGDDGLCMKSGDYKKDAVANGCSDILIDNCTVFHAHGGFVIGSEDITAMKNIVVRRCRFSGTDAGLRFKSAIGRGGRTENIYISDIVMTDIKGAAITFQCDYANRPAGHDASKEKAPAKLEKVPDFQDIHIQNVTCRGAKTAIYAHGIEGQDCVHDINISNSTIVYNKTGLDVDEKTAKLKLVNVTVKEDKQ